MTVIARRLLDEKAPDGYRESDKDFVLNNLIVASMLLERELRKENLSERAKKAIAVARRRCDDELEIDDMPAVSDTEGVEDADGGVWVQAWIWVGNEDIKG